MTKKSRRLIFYIFVFLFLFLAIAILLYAQGYNFNWEKKSLVLTGAFYLRSSPEKANIYLNEKEKGQTNKFIKRLLPDEYNIKVSKPNYYDWQKTLEIESKLVTKTDILLIKRNPLISQVVDYNVNYFSFSNDRKRMIYLTDKTTMEIDPTQEKIAEFKKTVNFNQFALRLIDFRDNRDIQIYPSPFQKDGRDFSIANLENLSNILWSSDNKKLLLFFPDNQFYLLNLDKSTHQSEEQFKVINLSNLIKILSKYKISSIQNPLFYPHNSNKISFLNQGNFYSIELNNSNESQSLISPVVSKILAYTIYNNDIFCIKHSDDNIDSREDIWGLYKTNLNGSSFEKIFDISFLDPKQIVKIINDKILIIDRDLYFFNHKTQVLEKIARDIEEINFSNNNKKMLWQTENEIGVIWLEPTVEEPKRQKYEIEIIMKTLKNINQAIWYPATNRHIIFTTNNDIKITELDGRDRRNTVNISSAKNPKVFYNNENNKLYILSEKKLYQVEF